MFKVFCSQNFKEQTLTGMIPITPLPYIIKVCYWISVFGLRLKKKDTQLWNKITSLNEKPRSQKKDACAHFFTSSKNTTTKDIEMRLNASWPK